MWLFFSLLFKTPSKSQQVHYRPEVFVCDHCYTFLLEWFFYQQLEGWVLVFSSRKWDGSAWNVSYWVGNFTCSTKMIFSLLDPVIPDHTIFRSCVFLHLFSSEWNVGMSRNTIIAHFHRNTTQPEEGKCFEIYYCLEILGQVRIVTFSHLPLYE